MLCCCACASVIVGQWLVYELRRKTRQEVLSIDCCSVEWSLALEVVRCPRVQKYTQDRSGGIFLPIGRVNERRNIHVEVLGHEPIDYNNDAHTNSICELRYAK